MMHEELRRELALMQSRILPASKLAELRKHIEVVKSLRPILPQELKGKADKLIASTQKLLVLASRYREEAEEIIQRAQELDDGQ